MMVLSKKKIGYESFMMKNGVEGQIFFSSQIDKDLVSLSCKLKRKIKTENFISVKVSNKKDGWRKTIPEVIVLTKVTLLNYTIENK